MSEKVRLFKRYYLFQWGVAGVLGAVIYFILFPKVDVYQYVDASLGKQAASETATQIAKNLGFVGDEGTAEASIKQQSDLLKPVISSTDRSTFKQHLASSKIDSSLLYPWEVGFTEDQILTDVDERNQNARNNGDEDNDPGPERKPLQIYLSQQGEWLGLENYHYDLPQRKTNPEVLEAVFPGIKDYIQQESLSDSLIANLLIFERSNLVEEDDTTADVRTGILKDHIQRNWQFQIGKKSALKMVKTYLEQTAWKGLSFQLDSIYTTTYKNRLAASLNLKRNQPFFGKDLFLRADILPSGALLRLEPSLESSRTSEDSLFKTISQTSLVIFLIIGIGVILVLFFKRLRARVIDLKTSLILAIMTGSLFPLLVVMSLIKQNVFSLTMDSIIPLLTIITVTGALGVFAFFILISVGESVARQVWVEKMMSFDLVRTGFILNRPVGIAVVRSVFASFSIIGLWALLVYFVPSAFAFKGEEVVFISDMVIAAPLLPLLDSVLLASIFTLSLFSILGSQIYSITKKTFWVFPFLFLGFALIDVLPMQIRPEYYDVLFKGILGVIFGYVFLKFGFLTTFLGLFQIGLITSVSSGWIAASSPDFFIFIMVVILSLGLLIFGFTAIVVGKKDQHLPNYVPDYVEELARENRIQQELEIAKEVQASFLPRSMPSVAPLDIAAICHPAYETGGDYFDVIQLDGHRVGIAIGDVSGKGIQAAFYMTLAKGIIHSLCHEIDNPRQLLHRANEIFYNNSSKNTFISMIYGVFDTRDNSFCFARAGHNPLLIKRKEDNNLVQLKPQGLALGITKDDIFLEHLKQESIKLKPGDTIILFTDGLNEALNRNHRFYGMDRIFEIVGNSKTLSADKLLVEIEQDISDFVGDSKQHDDLTLVILKVSEHKKKYELNKEHENKQLPTGSKLL